MTDSSDTPSTALADEIKFVDTSIGSMVKELTAKGLIDKTTIVITAKHGQSPIDPNRVLRIPADDPSKEPPSSVVTPPPVQALEDDVSLLWLPNHTPASRPPSPKLEANAAKIGADGGEFYSGPSLGLMFDVSGFAHARHHRRAERRRHLHRGYEENCRARRLRA